VNALTLERNDLLEKNAAVESIDKRENNMRLESKKFLTGALAELSHVETNTIGLLECIQSNRLPAQWSNDIASK